MMASRISADLGAIRCARATRISALLSTALLLAGCAAPPRPAVNTSQRWGQLFNGRDLSGWKQVNGGASYFVRDGAIVGVTAANSPNSFLATTTTFGDFVLEAQVKADAPMNTGINFRSVLAPEIVFSGLRGYQLEVDLSARAWTGGIYVEGEDRFLHPMIDNAQCRTAFRAGEWNDLRIEALGRVQRTWVNGAACANLVDPSYSAGVIALQVHAVDYPALNIHRADLAGREIMWRDIRILTDGVAEAMRPLPPDVAEASYLVNELTEHEVREGWRLISGPAPMQEGIVALSAGQSFDLAAGSPNFELVFDVRPQAKSAGAVQYASVTTLADGEPAAPLAFRVNDDVGPEPTEAAAATKRIGALYGLLPARNLSEPNRTKRYKGAGQWARGRILVQGGKVEHWLNAVKVLESRLDTIGVRARGTSGSIRLYAEAGMLDFRSIKLRELP